MLTASGCSEATTYGFIERAAAEPFVDTADVVVPVANPLSEKFAVLRPSLVPGLVDALIRNRRREHRDIRLFEIGHRFRRAGGESAGVAIALTGAGTLEHWSGRARASDLFDIKGVVERLTEAAGVTARIEPLAPGFLFVGFLSTALLVNAVLSTRGGNLALNPSELSGGR